MINQYPLPEVGIPADDPNNGFKSSRTVGFLSLQVYT